MMELFKKETPKITYLHAISRIQSRFATTLVTTRLENVSEVAKEAVFTITLPNAAFFSNFTMCVDGKTIVGEVKEKQEAKVQYERAKARGESAGHIAKAPRETNVFTISTNISAGGEASFNLTYQEILQRVHGVYKHVVNIQPGQIVEDLKVDVFISESNEITQVRVPQFSPKVGEKTNKELLTYVEENDVKVEHENASNVHVTYYPSVESQKLDGSENGTDGQFVVLYDVMRDGNGGELQVVNGYFVHFFAPTEIDPADKHVIFVLDRSGSMGGRKIQQTKDAMHAILRDLNENDRFNIICFNSSMEHWKKESVRATATAIDSAIAYIDQINAQGGTNIDRALKDALCMLVTKGDDNALKNSMVIFLTDGQPTAGECNNGTIISNAKALNKDINASVHCLGFGGDADYELLKKLAIENQGLARKIYEDSDAALQLQGFYAEVSQLLLGDITINYVNESVQPDSIVHDSNHNYYAGGEYVIVGRMAGSDDDFEVIDDNGVSGLTAKVDAMGIDGKKQFECACLQPMPQTKSLNLPLPPESVGGFVERMWAYLTIKQLLDRAKYGDTGSNVVELKQRALQLSLKYQFVTELTSMVVTQPEKETEMECVMEEFKCREPVYLQDLVQCLSSSCQSSKPAGGRRKGVARDFRSCKRTTSRFKMAKSDSLQCDPPASYEYISGMAMLSDEKSPPPIYDLLDTVGESLRPLPPPRKCQQQSGKHMIDINSDLPGMSLKDVVQLDWKFVAPQLTCMPINSLPMSTLSAIPWDDVIKFLPAEVITDLTSAVLQAIPPAAWQNISLEAWLAIKPQMLATLPLSSLKNVPLEHWDKMSPASLAAFKKDTLMAINPELVKIA